MSKELLVIGGATGTGKSDVAVQCALRLNGEVISADSMQIYRGMDIGTAKINKSEMLGVPHHMIDIISPASAFTVADYQKKAKECVEDIRSRGKMPIVCGGTGMYIHSLLYQMSYSGAYDPELRQSLNKELAEKGKEYMHAKLATMNASAAERLHVNDTKRVLRAIEKSLTGGGEEDDYSKPMYSYDMYLIERPRDILYKRIDQRVDKMIQKGLLQEVEGLLSQGINFDSQCMQAIAYKEWGIPLSREEIVALIKKNTRNYAKRQITWFKQYADAVHVDAEGKTAEEIAENICKDIRG